MKFETFDQIKELPESELRDLLNTGEDVERVWAAWVLALKLGSESAPELVSTATASPSSGLRRHLIVMLAGYGKLDLLEAFAENDPEPTVRATACLHLLQTRPIGNAVHDRFLLSILEKEPAPMVRALLLSNAVANNLPVPIERLIEFASDPATDVRAAAVAVLKECYSAEDAVAAGLIDTIKVETDKKILLEITSICAAASVGDRLLIAAKMRDSETRLLIWNYFEDQGAKFDWPVLEGYVDVVAHESPYHLLQLASDNALPQMLIWIVETTAQWIRQETYFESVFLVMIGKLLQRKLPVSITPDFKTQLEQVRGHMQLLINDVNETVWEDFEDRQEEWLEQLADIDEAITRFLSDN